MEFTRLAIPDVVLLTPKIFSDDRGFFMETFRQDQFEQHCGSYQFVQDNHSCSGKGILRGLHYQYQKPQGKLIRVTKGEIFDVVVDMRKQSPTYGQWVGMYLNDTTKQMIWVPPGFAHGFYVISDSAEFQYKCTDYYSPGDEYTLRWNDSDIGIQWPLLEGNSPVLSGKDQNGLAFSQCPYF